MAVALFFFSCENEDSLLGFKNPNKKFRVGSVDIPLGVSSVLSFDSLITDLKPIVTNNQPQFVDGILVGQYQDPDFGKINAESYLTIYPIGDAALPATAQFDSITIQLRLNFYSYGFADQKLQQFSIHEITGDTLSLYGGHRYYANSPAPVYSPDMLGEALIRIHPDTLHKEAVAEPQEQDTLLIRGRLDQAYGEKVFEAFKAGFTGIETRRLFRNQFRGIALIPGAEPGILGMNIINNFGQPSRIIMHFHTMTDAGAVADTLERHIGFEYASFTRISADRAGTEIDGLVSYQSVDLPGGRRYIQSGAPVITKLDLAPFYAFADTVDNIMINEAELIIDNVSGVPGMNPHDGLQLRLMNNQSDQFLNNHIAADRQLAANYYVNSSQLEYYYFAANEGSGPATIGYDESSHRFSGFMTLFAQSMFAHKNDEDGINENRLRYVALFPANPSATRGISRTLFQKENVKLRVVYTRANTATP